jgi:hypothetical protein
VSITAASFHFGTGILTCSECDGEGRRYTSRYGGNDPDVWDAGVCLACDGDGNQVCEDCGDHPAVATWTVHGKTYLVCRACHDHWLEDEA